jgi:hypothetical protein
MQLVDVGLQHPFKHLYGPKVQCRVNVPDSYSRGPNSDLGPEILSEIVIVSLSSFPLTKQINFLLTQPHIPFCFRLQDGAASADEKQGPGLEFF